MNVRKQQADLIESILDSQNESFNEAEFDDLLDQLNESGYEIVKKTEAQTSTSLKQFESRMESLLQMADKIQQEKNPAYSGGGNQDFHKNFKMIADMLDVDPMMVWAVYLMKHVSALVTYAKDPSIEQAESISGRFADALNYIRIGYSLDKEIR